MTVDALRKVYGKVTAFDGVDFTLDRPRIAGFAGPDHNVPPGRAFDRVLAEQIVSSEVPDSIQ